MAKRSTGAKVGIGVGIGVGVALIGWFGYQAYQKDKEEKEFEAKKRKILQEYKEDRQKEIEQEQLENISAQISGTIGQMF